MGLADALAAEDRIEVKCSDFYKLVRAESERAIMKNAVTARVPHEMILKMLTGKNDELEEYRKTELTPEQIREMDRLYAEKCNKVRALTAETKALQKQLDELKKQLSNTVAEAAVAFEALPNSLSRMTDDGK